VVRSLPAGLTIVRPDWIAMTVEVGRHTPTISKASR